MLRCILRISGTINVCSIQSFQVPFYYVLCLGAIQDLYNHIVILLNYIDFNFVLVQKMPVLNISTQLHNVLALQSVW